jgi:hypothetical protein
MTTLFISQLQKDLTDRRTRLALQINIPDLAAHALEWNKLGADFAAAGWPNNAGICFSNAARYGAMEPGEYQRLLQELSPIVRVVKVGDVEQVEMMPEWVDPDERMLACATCDTWTKHVRLTDGWMCSCGTYIEAVTVASVEELL